MLVLANCAGTGPYRSTDSATLSASLGPECQQLYAQYDEEIRQISTDFQKTNEERDQFLQGMHDKIANAPANLAPCWQTAHEKHPWYDLYYAEFDDAGQATDIAKGTSYEQSQLHLIETAIRNALPTTRTSTSADEIQGLNIVVFTHGWHGNARADNNYSTEFKAILQDVAIADDNYRKRLAAEANAAPSQPTRRQLIGIEIAWRGDSLLTPPLLFYKPSKNALNVWDRKVTAETISTGSVQELFAFLNEIYLDNSCHGPRPSKVAASCDRVHMLSIGHSFGALINYRALAPRLESGLNVPLCYRVFGFGDMTILLNPAFEGARYRGLFNNAISRKSLIGPYVGADPAVQCPATAVPLPPNEKQIPSLVTLQSQGDTATGTFFPIFRHVTTPLEQTLSTEENGDKNTAVGWVPDYQTHTLDPEPAGPDAWTDQCSPPHAPSFCPFRASGQADTAIKATEAPLPGLALSWKPNRSDLPDYMPLWTVAVNSHIMQDHDDFWNPQIVRLITLLFADAYEQTERLHGR
jgi:hypothetical protein